MAPTRSHRTRRRASSPLLRQAVTRSRARALNAAHFDPMILDTTMPNTTTDSEQSSEMDHEMETSPLIDTDTSSANKSTINTSTSTSDAYSNKFPATETTSTTPTILTGPTNSSNIRQRFFAADPPVSVPGARYTFATSAPQTRDSRALEHYDEPTCEGAIGKDQVGGKRKAPQDHYERVSKKARKDDTESVLPDEPKKADSESVLQQESNKADANFAYHMSQLLGLRPPKSEITTPHPTPATPSCRKLPSGPCLPMRPFPTHPTNRREFTFETLNVAEDILKQYLAAVQNNKHRFSPLNRQFGTADVFEDAPMLTDIHSNQEIYKRTTELLETGQGSVKVYVACCKHNPPLWTKIYDESRPMGERCKKCRVCGHRLERYNCEGNPVGCKGCEVGYSDWGERWGVGGGGGGVCVEVV